MGALAVAPLLIRNTVFVGNPFAPLLAQWFGVNDDIMSLAEFDQLSQMVENWGMGHGLLDFLALPARLVLEEWPWPARQERLSSGSSRAARPGGW